MENCWKSPTHVVWLNFILFILKPQKNVIFPMFSKNGPPFSLGLQKEFELSCILFLSYDASQFTQILTFFLTHS